VKERNKIIQDLKIELETIKKSQSEATLELENLGKRSGVRDASITNRIQEIEERISGAQDTIENIGSSAPTQWMVPRYGEDSTLCRPP
jgi:predicted  nucleic acid-binding Zn-ribbon protein